MNNEKKIEDGGSAFPHGPLGDSMHGEAGLEWPQYNAHGGMSLRDWFAGQALYGMANLYPPAYAPALAIAAYAIADEMIKHRTK